MRSGISTSASHIRLAAGLAGIAAIFLSSTNVHATQYSAIALSQPLTNSTTVATGLNDIGQAVGYYAWQEADGTLNYRAAVWNAGGVTTLSTLGGNFTYATAINNAGQVSGYASTLNNTATQAVMWNGGSISQLGDHTGESWGYSINNSGQVAGYTYRGFETAAVWSGSNINILNPLPNGTYARAFGINDAGQVVGDAAIPNSTVGGTQAVVWNNGVASELGTLGGFLSRAYDINNVGITVGNATLWQGGSQATMWNDGGINNLGTLGGRDSSARSINDGGQIVGTSEIAIGSPHFANGETHAFLWENGQMLDLNDLLANSTITLTEAVAINNSGQILANAFDPTTSITTAYLLTPVPLPAAAWFFLTGLLGLARIRKTTFTRKHSRLTCEQS